MKMHRRQRQHLISELWAAQSGRCAGCGGLLVPLGWLTEEGQQVSIDHVWPRSLGGPDNAANFVLMHKICNSNRGNAQPTGCLLIWNELARAWLGESRHDIPSDSSRPTLGDIWPHPAPQMAASQ